MKPQKIENRDTRTSKFDRFKGAPRHAQCSKCGSTKRYTNPMARCWECKKKFCFKHIWGGQINETMGGNEQVRDICEDCKKSRGYKTLQT